MKQVEGTKGYANNLDKFVTATNQISFKVLHKDFLAFFPEPNSLILDAGAGIGRDAFELSKLGYDVVAVEPLSAFRKFGESTYPLSNIKWLDDAMPFLTQLEGLENSFDFILCSGVWHHLQQEEQSIALARLAELISPEGKIALTLRNGPAGVGTHVFPTNMNRTIEEAKRHGLQIIFKAAQQPSLLKGKTKVHWSKLVLKKVRRK